MASIGSRFYYEKGYIRIGIKLDPIGLFMLKSQAIDEEKSLTTLIGEAVAFMIENSDNIPSTFSVPNNSEITYTFIKKRDHKSLKKISVLIQRPICDIAGFMVSLWNKAYASKDKS